MNVSTLANSRVGISYKYEISYKTVTAITTKFTWGIENHQGAVGSGTLYYMVRSYSGSGEFTMVALIF
jgi:hypothetical protein